MIAVAVLIVLVAVVFVMRKDRKLRPLTPLSSLAFVFILMGILFSDSSRWFVYGMFGIGIVLAILDIIMKRK